MRSYTISRCIEPLPSVILTKEYTFLMLLLSPLVGTLNTLSGLEAAKVEQGRVHQHHIRKKSDLRRAASNMGNQISIWKCRLKNVSN